MRVLIVIELIVGLTFMIVFAFGRSRARFIAAFISAAARSR
jgi:hypothetical protein